MKAYGSGCIDPHFLDFGTSWVGEWLDSRPGRFIPKERAPGTHWIGGWVDRSGRLLEQKILDYTGIRTPKFKAVVTKVFGPLPLLFREIIATAPCLTL
jgi:hypothetical protein